MMFTFRFLLNRFIFASVFIAVISAMAFAQGHEAAEIKWMKDFKEAKKTAFGHSRPLLLDFTAPWCKPCLAMDKEFWVRQDVVKAVEPFIAVKVDFDVQRDLAVRYGVNAIPNVVFTDPLGNVITNRPGFSAQRVAELINVLKIMPKDFSVLKPYYDQIEMDKHHTVANIKIADAYRSSTMYYLSNFYYLNALENKEIKADPINHERISAIIGANYFLNNDFESAAGSFSEYLKNFPKGASREVVIYNLILTNCRREKKKDALKQLEKLKAEFPESKRIESALKNIEMLKK